MLIGGKYRLGARIGGGGMAEVFEATLIGAEGFERPVAIKRMLPSLSTDPSFGDMFVNEARIASLLHHPSVASVLDFDRDPEGRYFIVMELVRGVDLRTVADGGRLPIAVSLHIIAELLRGLDYAHELVNQGKHLRIVHRDVSPHNVMVSWSGAVKLVDFGIAKAVAATGASRSGSLKGKVAYMSPEQAHGHELDGRSDVFAVGVMAHELLTGRRLFDGATEPEVLARLLTQPIPAPSELAGDIPPDVDRAVMSMLARDPARRAASAGHALEMVIASSATSPRAALELRGLLAARFPERAPTRGASGAGSALGSALSPGATPGLPGGTLPGGTLTADAAAMAAPSAAPAIAPVPRSRGQMGLLVGAAIVSVVAIVVALAIRSSRTDTAASNQPDAATTVEAMDASMIARVTIVDGGAIVSGADAREPTRDRRSDAGSTKAGASVDAGGTRGRDRRRREPSGDAPPTVDKSTSTASDSATGILKVTAKPWANVSIKGKSYGLTPVDIVLPPGRYSVVLVNDKLEKRHKVGATVKANRTSRVRKTMTD